jgi:phosphohistidine phosphatase SixA
MATGIEVPEGHPPVSPGGGGCLPDGHSPVDGYEYCNEVAEDDDKNDDKPSGNGESPVADKDDDKPTGNGDSISGGNDSNEGGGRPSEGNDSNEGGGRPSGGNDSNEGGGRPSVEGDPVYVTYHHGRRGNSGQGLYYVGGTHRIGLAEYGLEAMKGTEPKKFIPLWMNDKKSITTSLFDAPRPGGSREGKVTGILQDGAKAHIVFKDENDTFRRQSFDLNNKEGMASGGEKKAKNSWIYKNEIAHAIDLNGDQIFGNPSKKPNDLSEAEYNNTAFENKLSDKKLLRKLQKGGLVIYMRHATTEKDYADQADPNLDLNDPSTQRMLSEQGIQEATSIGAGFKANDILIGKVFSSEYQRAKDTAELAFGKYKEKSKLNFLPFEDYTDDQLDIYHDRVAPMLAKKPNNTKKNTVIVGHDDPFEGTTNIYPDPQGTAYVLNPRGENFEILAQLKPNDWAFNADI